MEYRKRAKYMILAHVYLIFLISEYNFFVWLFYVLPINFQWVMSIVLPAARELGAYFLTKILEKAAGKKDSSGEIIAAHQGEYLPVPWLSIE